MLFDDKIVSILIRNEFETTKIDDCEVSQTAGKMSEKNSKIVIRGERLDTLTLQHRHDYSWERHHSSHYFSTVPFQGNYRIVLDSKQPVRTKWTIKEIIIL